MNDGRDTPTFKPRTIHIGGTDGLAVVQELAYGENPRHRIGEENQKSRAFLCSPVRHVTDPLSILAFTQLTGREPSYINITDLHRLLETGVRLGAAWQYHFNLVPKIAIAVKHGNACGVGVSEDDPIEALTKMIEGDAQAISGGSILVNFDIDERCAKLLREHATAEAGTRILDVIAAPRVTDEAIDILERKTGKCRIFVNQSLEHEGLGNKNIDCSMRVRQVRGGFLTQDGDSFVLELPQEIQRTLSFSQIKDVIIGWAIGSTSASNTIVLVKDQMMVGIGLAQASRVRACEVAIQVARWCNHSLKGATAYSDSFFPVTDGPVALAQAGISTIFASSGALRDQDVQNECTQRGVRLIQMPDSLVRGFYHH